MIKNKKENKNFDQNLTNLYRKVFRIRISGYFSMPAGGILSKTKKNKEYSKCLFNSNHHILVFENKLVFFTSLTKNNFYSMNIE